MHNPITNSGGVMLGKVKEIGEGLKGIFKLQVGEGKQYKYIENQSMH